MEAIGLATGVKWSKLTINAKIKAIWERLMGGGRNPHGALFAHARNYMTGTKTEAEIMGAINDLRDGWRKDAIKLGFINFLTLFRDVHGPLASVDKRLFVGHIGRFKIWAQPQICIRIENQILFLLLWNNKKPELDRDTAEIGCLIMKDSYSDQPNARFVCADLRTGTAYELRADTIDARRAQAIEFCLQIEKFVVKVEDEIKRRRKGDDGSDHPGDQPPPP